MFDRPSMMLALVMGLFGQVAFFADLGRGVLPTSLRVAAHMVPFLPLLFIEPPRASAPAEGRSDRALLVFQALSGVAYAGLSMASFGLAAAGVHPPGLWLYLALQAPGTAVALITVAGAARALRPLRPKLERPFVGTYRTRVFAPNRPPRRPAARAPGRWPNLCHLMVSLGFSGVGVFMTLYPRSPDDALMGPFCTALFGLGAWVFIEQLCADGHELLVATGARRRILTMFWLLGPGLIYLAATSPGASLSLQAFVGLSGVGCCLLAVKGSLRASRGPARARPEARPSGQPVAPPAAPETPPRPASGRQGGHLR